MREYGTQWVYESEDILRSFNVLIFSFSPNLNNQFSEYLEKKHMYLPSNESFLNSLR